MSVSDEKKLKINPTNTQPLTKLLIPGVPANYLRRERLSEQYQDAFRHRILLVTAPAGYGKTTFLSDTFTRMNCPLTWITLDKKDNSLAAFWSIFIMALQKINPEIGEKTLAILQKGDHYVEQALTELINEMNIIVSEIYLVLDDYHCIASKTIHASLDFLINYLPPQLHLILSTRVNPPLSLNRLRARGFLAEITTDDLRFTHEETAQYFFKFNDETTNPSITKETIVFMHSCLEGWIAGLQMVATSIRGGGRYSDVNALYVALMRSKKDILEYLISEVLDQQQEDVRDFLLKTSIFDRFNGALCNHVMEREDSQQVLNDLMENNLFVQSLDNEGEWFRYHSLFKDSLYKKLMITRKDSLPSLHSRASYWFEKQGLMDEAIEHAFDTLEFDRVIDLLNQYAVMYLGEDKFQQILGWTKILPEEFLEKSIFANAASTIAYECLRLRLKSKLHLQAALKICETVDMSKYRDSRYYSYLLVAPYLLKSLEAFFKGDMLQAIQYASGGLDAVPEEEIQGRSALLSAKAVAHWRYGELDNSYSCCVEGLGLTKLADLHYTTSLFLAHIAHIQFAKGHLKSASATCQETIQIGQQYETEPCPSSYAYLLSAQILYQKNSLDEAEGQICHAVDLSGKNREPAIWLSSQMALARIHIARGETKIAMEIARNAKIMYENVLPKNNLADLFMTRLWLMLEDESTAEDYCVSWSGLLHLPNSKSPNKEELFALFQNGIYFNDIRDIWVEIPLLTYIRVKFAQGKLDGLIEILESIHQEAEMRQWKTLLIETMILETLVYNAVGNNIMAFQLLKETLNLVKKENFLRLFVDEGQAMYNLLQQALIKGLEVDYISEILSCYNGAVLTDSNHSSPKLCNSPEFLTQREREVLQLICTGFSNQDIADKLFIGHQTAKNYVHHIYEKLGVVNRVQAIIQSKALSLLDLYKQ